MSSSWEVSNACNLCLEAAERPQWPRVYSLSRPRSSSRIYAKPSWWQWPGLLDKCKWWGWSCWGRLHTSSLYRTAAQCLFMTQYTFTGKVHSNVQISGESLQHQSRLAEELMVLMWIQLYSTLLGYSTTMCVVELFGTSWNSGSNCILQWQSK